MILLTGNISYAVSHLDCAIEEDIHHKCSSNCCEMDETCESSEKDSNDKNTVEKDCCDIHESDQPNHQYTFPASINVISNLFPEVYTTSENPVITELQGFTYAILKFDSSNIYLSVSNLRI